MTDEQVVHWMPARTAGPAVRMMLSGGIVGRPGSSNGNNQPDHSQRSSARSAMTRLIGPLGPQLPAAAEARLPVVRCRTAGAPGTRYGLLPDQDQEEPW